MGMRRSKQSMPTATTDHLGYQGYSELLWLVPKPPVVHTHPCPFCKRPVHDPRKTFCKPTHRRSYNDVKWGSAGAALYGQLQLAALTFPTPTLSVVKHTLAYYGRTAARRTRRNALMALYGLVYEEAAQTWVQA
jgi:hypothetical protein